MAQASRPPRGLRPGGLFWRTFLLIAALILASLAAWGAIFRAFEQTPRAQQVAWEISSVVNLTRAALVSAEPLRRRMLLDDLEHDEGVRVDVLEPDDEVEPLPPSGLAQEVAQRLRTLLGAGTRTAAAVNGVRGFWVSFEIEGDGYWLMVERSRVDRVGGPGWAAWALTAIALSLAGAFATARLVDRPLADLARALRALAQGGRPAPLAETGTREIAELNRQFNRMAEALAALESDRAIALAGISHDVRTPLTRLRIEAELAGLPEATRASMAEDIEAIDRIVGQFVEFARGGAEGRPQPVDAAAAVAALRQRHEAQIGAGTIDWDDTRVEPAAAWLGRATDFQRILSNLVENASRYGRGADGRLALRIELAREARGVRLAVVDGGPGVPPAELDRLARPFARLDAARGAAAGSGLGLAIVERLAGRYGGRLRLWLPPEGGLAATVELPDAGARTSA